MDDRIKVIDGFRCLAVLGVVFFHFLYRFSPPITTINYVPYQFGQSILQYGYFGVQLFFVISGFVICRTLEASVSLADFLIRRLIRLWPTLLICSLTTYFFVKALEQSYSLGFFHTSIWSFLPSLTFSTPELWNGLFPELTFTYVDGVYWSLFVEAVFYLLSAVIFFSQPKYFLRNWLIFVLVVLFTRIGTSPRLAFLFNDQTNFFLSGFYRWHFLLHLTYLPYFSVGIFFFYLHSNRAPRYYLIMMMCVITLLEFYFLQNSVLRLLFICIIVLFGIFVFRSRWLTFLSNPVFVWVGLVSYPLYLLHSSVGIILINLIAPWSVSWVSNGFLPIVVTVILIMFSTVIFIFFERPVSLILRRRLQKVRGAALGS